MIKLERAWIERRNAYYQNKTQPTHAEVYDQVNRDTIEVCNRFGTDINELLTRTRSKKVAEARAVICTVALERLRPLGISEGDVAKFLGMSRTTMRTALERWQRNNKE